MKKIEIELAKQKFFIETLESFFGDNKLELTSEEKESNKKMFEELSSNKYIAEISHQTSGDDSLIIKLMELISAQYDEESESVVATVSRISTLERCGLDYAIYHESDIKQGSITLDLHIHCLKPISSKDALLLYKMFDKIETAVDNGICWLFK